MNESEVAIGQVWQDGEGAQWLVVYATSDWAWIKPRRHKDSPSIMTNTGWFKEWQRIV